MLAARVVAIYQRLRVRVGHHLDGPVPGVLVEGPWSDFPTVRDFAYCDREGTIVVAPRLSDQGADRIEAILRHEFGHVVQLLLDTFDDEDAEADADRLAEMIWGDPIYYDHEDVQTLRPTGRTRADLGF